jgi:hypothetical protein
MSSKLAEFDRIFTYHEPDDAQIAVYREIRRKARELAEFISEACPESREKSLAFTKIEEAVMWANAAVARYPDAA